MGKGGKSEEFSSNKNEKFLWSEVIKHNKRGDRWLVIGQEIFNVSNFAKKHPGGSAIIGHYAGQDATEAFIEFHKDKKLVSKYMSHLKIGEVEGERWEGITSSKNVAFREKKMREDFAQLRKTAEKMDLFKPSKLFYLLIIGHLILFEMLAYFVLYFFGTSWIPIFLSIIFYTIVQAQAGWSQHDFGHLSVFRSPSANRLAHSFVMNIIKGASTSWWQHLHNQHHSKPNVINKDPDVRLEKVFVLGENIPKRIAKEKKSTLPYNWQHHYFFLIGPPLLFPIFFQFMIFKHPISRGQWKDVLLMTLFYIKIFILYTPFFGLAGTLIYYFAIRCLESHWFVWVSQSNHVPMDIDDDKERPWLALQLNATCDIEKSFFNDWFTGHLNFQIEHHCFPTMPRHNLYKIKPFVENLCQKYQVPYQCKTIYQAFADIIRSLKHSGEIWYAHYQSYNL